MQNVITFRRLGRYGRFANSLFQYMGLRLYALEHDCELQVPPWIGTELFGLHDPPVTEKLPPYHEKSADGTCHTQSVPPEGDELVNHDFLGYAQYHTSYYRPHKYLIRSMFTPVELIQQRLAPAVRRLRSAGKTVVGIHLRRGDYGRSIFYITPVAWYLDWLRKYWPLLDGPVLFIAAEDRKLVREFAEYKPHTVESLGVDFKAKLLKNYAYLVTDLKRREPWQLDFYPDFWLLSQCHVLLIPNSTYSFVAAMLSRTLELCYRSHLPTQRFVQIDPWDTYPLDHEKAEDYRHISGVCLDETAYWRRKPNGKFSERC